MPMASWPRMKAFVIESWRWSSAALTVDRALTDTERFVVLPLFLAVPALVAWIGQRAIRTRRIRLRRAWLYGRSEATGNAAVVIGWVHLLLALAMVAGIVAMMILGRPLL